MKKSFIKKFNPKILPFKKLPIEYQYAMIWYMTFDGEAWEWPDDKWQDIIWWKGKQTNTSWQKHVSYMKKYMKKHINYFIDTYGDEKFGMVEVPTDVICKEVAKREDNENLNDFDSFEEYHQWYIKNMKETFPKHRKTNRWPCILSTRYSDDVIEDGWHRFHCYIKRKDKTIPCLFYV